MPAEKIKVVCSNCGAKFHGLSACKTDAPVPQVLDIVIETTGERWVMRLGMDGWLTPAARNLLKRNLNAMFASEKLPYVALVKSCDPSEEA